MGDGSVMFVNDSINVATWLALLSQADGTLTKTELIQVTACGSAPIPKRAVNEAHSIDSSDRYRRPDG